MIDLTSLPVGTRVRWVRDDPVVGNYGLPECFRNAAFTITGCYLSDAKAYIGDFDHHRDSHNWGLLVSMLKLEEGPW